MDELMDASEASKLIESGELEKDKNNRAHVVAKINKGIKEGQRTIYLTVTPRKSTIEYVKSRGYGIYSKVGSGDGSLDWIVTIP